jgi:hypothetical protein
MFYTIYKITNIVNGYIYIGQHTTDNLDDGYMGSGIRLINAYKKHGKDIFKKEILYIFDNFEEMDLKESELVNEEFIKRPDVYNSVLGGTGWCSKGTAVVEHINTPGIFTRIPREQYDRTLHRYITSSTIQVYLKSTGDRLRIPIEEYHKNKELYNTMSSGRVSVMEKTSGKTSSILISDFDPEKYDKVLGGIVANVNGVKKYVTREQFITENLSGVHKGKVTVIDTTDNIRKHVTSEEYHKNKDRYISNGTGTVNVINKNTGERYRLPIDIVNDDKEKYIVGTSGWATVFDMKLNKFINIPKGTLDRHIHKLAQDKKFICYNIDGSIKFEFWGGKKEFLEKYKCPESVWAAALKGKTFISNKKRSAEFNGCKFMLIDWKPQK